MAEPMPTPEVAEPTSSKTNSRNPQLRDQRKLPEGVVPKQAQGYVVAGLAVLILMAVMFSKTHPRPATTATPITSAAVSTDVNQRKIQELEQDLSAQQRLASAQRANAVAPPLSATSSMSSFQPGVPSPAPLASPPVAAQPPEPSRDPVADAEREMAFKARFASNLVGPHEDVARSPASDTVRSTALPQAAAVQPASTVPSTSNKRALEVNLNSAHGQPFVLFEGTTIDTVLVNRLDGEFSGPVKVMVTNPAYSQDHQHILIPEGTFVLGDVQKVSSLGQKRLAVTFHRMLMPDGYSVDLDQFHGLDQAGDTGLKDKVNNHYLQIFGASIALGVIAGAAQATNQNQGYNQSGSEAYKAGIASSLSQSGTNILNRFINIPPTITIREGHRIKIYITQDMLLPAYENHDMPEVF
jgi:type IV secretion system protein VirB10